MFGMLLFLLGSLVLLGSLSWLAFSLVKRKKLKQPLLLFFISLFLGGAGAILSPTEEIFLTISQETIETDAEGLAFIIGETNPKATLTADGKVISTKAGTFSQEFQLNNNQEKTVTLITELNDKAIEKQVLITPSDSFIAFLKSEQEKVTEEENLAIAVTTLEQAEKHPTQKNYDEAATKIRALSQEYEHLDTRLTTVKDHLAITAAVDTAEQSLNQADFDTALALLSNATLAKENYQNRLDTLQEKISEKEKKEKLYATARAAVETAENTLTNKDYQTALDAIEKLPEESKDLTTRIKTVKETIAQQAAQEQAQAAQEAETNSQGQQDAVEQMVMVTPTGSKYHTHKCGNGNYYETTLTEALNRGLTPCSKCY